MKAENRVCSIDVWMWVIVLVLAALAAFTMMKRDAARNFGAVSYGMFPQFHLKDQHGKDFDFHNLKGHVWAVRFESPSHAIVSDLERLATTTVSAGKRLYLLTLSDRLISSIDDPFHYNVSGQPEAVNDLRRMLGFPSDTSVILIDQTSAIRGVYDLSDADDLRRFSQNLRALL